MHYYIFHKASKALLYDAATEAQFNNEYRACLANEDGGPDDFIVAHATPPTEPGQIPTLVGDAVVFVPNPEIVAKAELKAAAHEKLRALGLNDAEIGAL
jgi:hypothetical protein